MKLEMDDYGDEGAVSSDAHLERPNVERARVPTGSAGSTPAVPNFPTAQELINTVLEPPDNSHVKKYIVHQRMEVTLYNGKMSYPPRMLSCWIEGYVPPVKKEKKVVEAKIKTEAEEVY